ncbi:hypothetical protein OSTOST_16948, partial [Ostertagia ostertagi]
NANRSSIWDAMVIRIISPPGKSAKDIVESEVVQTVVCLCVIARDLSKHARRKTGGCPSTHECYAVSLGPDTVSHRCCPTKCRYYFNIVTKKVFALRLQRLCQGLGGHALVGPMHRHPGAQREETEGVLVR